MAAESPTGRIIDILVTRASGDFDARRVAASIETRQRAGALPVMAARTDAASIARHLRPDVRSIPITRTEAARTLCNALGKRIGQIGLSYRQPSIRPATVMNFGRDRAMSVADAALALTIAKDRHNANLKAAEQRLAVNR